MRNRWLALGLAAVAGLSITAAARQASDDRRTAPRERAEPTPNQPALGTLGPLTRGRSPEACCDPADDPPPAGKRVLRVSADPNNLPFTNDRLEGFENKIAAILAAEMGAELHYNWRAQRRGFFRTAFKEGEADLVLGVPAGFDMALTTAPYYRSTYVFVTRKDRGPAVRSLDDPALKKLRIGVQLVGNDGVNTPPAHALAARGIVENVTGYTLYGDYREENPPARIVEAVAKGDIDVAVAWGPMAAFFAKRQPVALEVTPVTPEVDPPGLRFTFGIAMGVRRGNKELRDEVDAILKRRKADIDRILDDYGVPRVAAAAPKPDRRG